MENSVEEGNEVADGNIIQSVDNGDCIELCNADTSALPLDEDEKVNEQAVDAVSFTEQTAAAEQQQSSVKISIKTTVEDTKEEEKKAKDHSDEKYQLVENIDTRTKGDSIYSTRNKRKGVVEKKSQFKPPTSGGITDKANDSKSIQKKRPSKSDVLAKRIDANRELYQQHKREAGVRIMKVRKGLERYTNLRHYLQGDYAEDADNEK